MRKVAIITDTASDFNEEEMLTYNVKMLHYQIVYKDKTYKDQVEITSKQVIDGLETEIPTTSLPALDEIQRVIESCDEPEILIITLSSGLSGCFNAVSAITSDYPDRNITVFDSKTISVPQGGLVRHAAILANEGKTAEEIVEVLETLRAKQHTFFVVDTLKYLIHGGRIGRVTGTIGNMLNLKPIIHIGDDGKYETITKVRGRTKAIHYIAEEVSKILLALGDKPREVYMSHASGEDIKNKIIAEIKELVPNFKVDGERWISPVSCVHCGPGYVGIVVQELI